MPDFFSLDHISFSFMAFLLVANVVLCTYRIYYQAQKYCLELVRAVGLNQYGCDRNNSHNSLEELCSSNIIIEVRSISRQTVRDIQWQIVVPESLEFIKH